MANLKDDNRAVRLTSSTIESPESKEHLISYSSNTKRDIERLKTYINDVSVNALKTLSYTDGFGKDGVEDGISGETVISLLDANSGNGSVFYDETNIRSKTVYESLLALEEMIKSIEIPEDSSADLSNRINLLTDRLTQLKNSTLGNGAIFSPTFNPSIAQHLYELIFQCFDVVDDEGKLNDLSNLYSDSTVRESYTANFTLNTQVSRSGIVSCSDSFSNLDEELEALYSKIGGTSCADFDFNYNENDFCFIVNPISNIKDFCETSAQKICELSNNILQHETRILALEQEDPIAIDDASEEIKGIVKIASEDNIRGAVRVDPNNVALCLTPGGFLDFLESVPVIEFRNTSSAFSSKFMSGYKKAMNVCSINELDDVDTVNPDNGDVLKWSEADNKWIAGPDNTSLGSVTSVNGEVGEVILDAKEIKTVGTFFGATNPTINIVLESINVILSSLAEVATSGLAEHVEMGGNPNNYTAQNEDVASHLNGIDSALGELSSQIAIENATEDISGIVEIATEEEVALGADDERAITPAKLNTKLLNSNYFKYAETINSEYVFTYPILGGSVFRVSQSSESFDYGTKTLNRNDILIFKEKVESENELNSIEGNNKSFVLESSSSILNQINISWNDVSNKPNFGTASTYNVGSSAGQIPVIGSDGKLLESILPISSNQNSSGTETFTFDIQGTSSALSYISAQFQINPSKDVKSVIICNALEGKRVAFTFSHNTDSYEIGKQIEFILGSTAEEGSFFISKNRTTGTEDIELNTKGSESVIYTKINETLWAPQFINSGHVVYKDFKTIEEPSPSNTNTRTYDIYPTGRKNIIYLKSHSGGAVNIVYDLFTGDSGIYSYGEGSYIKEFKFVDSSGTNKTNSFIKFYNESGRVLPISLTGRTSDTITLQCVGKVTSTSNPSLTGKLIWRLLD